MREERCVTFSYHEETQQCTLSSKSPVAADDDAGAGLVSPLVFMKGLQYCILCSTYSEGVVWDDDLML